MINVREHVDSLVRVPVIFVDFFLDGIAHKPLPFL